MIDVSYKVKKFVSILIIVLMVVTLSNVVFAQEVEPSDSHIHGRGCPVCEDCGKCLCDKNTDCCYWEGHGKDKLRTLCEKCDCEDEPVIPVEPVPTTAVAKFYLHIVEDINTVVYGSAPSDSSQYFPSAGNGLTKTIIIPTAVPTNTGNSNDYTWRTWNNVSVVNACINGGFSLADFTVPSNVTLTGTSVIWYVIKDQADGWHVDGYVEGVVDSPVDPPEEPKDPEEPVVPPEKEIVYVDRPVYIEKPIYIDRIQYVPVEKIVEKIVEVEVPSEPEGIGSVETEETPDDKTPLKDDCLCAQWDCICLWILIGVCVGIVLLLVVIVQNKKILNRLPKEGK